jgi:hypothetical protein
MVEMGPVALFGRAWDVAKRNRILWILGFVASLSGELLSSIRIGPELNLLGPGDLLGVNILDIESWLRGLRLLGGSLVVAAAFTAIGGACMLAAVLAARAGLVEVTDALDRDASPGAARTVLRDGARLLMPLLEVTLMLYVPYLVVSELAGEAMRLAPGILKLPLYVVLLALLVVGAALPFFHALAICSIVLDGRAAARRAVDRSWQMVCAHRAKALEIWGVLLILSVICQSLAHAIMGPLSGASFLSLLLTALRGSFPDLGQVLGLVLLGAVSTAVAAPAYVFSMVVVTLAYRRAA